MLLALCTVLTAVPLSAIGALAAGNGRTDATNAIEEAFAGHKV